ncbi:hypothetical protein TVAG_151210 [Trichomonas vaginalis G3]|uniref:Uncharacterized protein n=1 Tax=Trichomonas vaginalis (strain ATCC PRA-98 / G3) TaxID=412133 RepID=A2EQB8_TRIV3|nr:hypothetical protein TVAGG3_0726440 [Trichomonas vaginalis G3]EAY05134.1 hypothetical protein TVAG_151210 [Trichomonas vaginalis G3]KAI5510944.1 hypothetical protein TVAGG3_0726440 [Trichomonas vaginalis G3]|eukprot:XP_001317357.1 hypothetical protein [Trichomonas vaginalis G3]
MIYHGNGFASLSKTNISNCISLQRPGFMYRDIESTVNVSFCNFENLKATDALTTQFWKCPGRIDRCNYINNSQNNKNWGIVYVSDNRHDIFDSSFQNNPQINKGKLFEAYYGQIYIHRCSIDSYSSVGYVDTSEKGEVSFKNILKFVNLSPREGNLEIVLLFVPKKENKIISLCPSINFLFGKYHISILFLIK